MRTTIDLPDGLLRQAKARAALDGLKLKDLITHYVEQGLRRGEGPPAGGLPSARRRSPLPIIQKAATGQPIQTLTKAELVEIDLDEDLAKHGRSAGR